MRYETLPPFMSIQLLSILFFYVLIFLVGVYAAQREKQSPHGGDMILAGRDLSLAVGIFTMTATWVGGGYINGTAEAVYDHARGLLWAQAPWGYAISLAIGGLLFARVMHGHGFRTLLDPFERRYGKRMAAILFVPALLGEIFWSAAILTALGTTFGTILGYDFSISIIVSSAVAIAYTMLGGLRAVAYTDVVQLICIALGLVIALPFAIGHAGGMGHVVDTYSASFGERASFFPPTAAFFGRGDLSASVWQWTDLALLLMLGGVPWQVYFQRVLACRSANGAVGMSLAAAVGCIVLAIPPILIGAVGATADWSLAGASAPANPALVLPQVLHTLVPPWIGVIGLGAVAAAVMSSVDSSILSASSMFMWNIYRPLLRPEASPEAGQRTMRIAVLVVGAAATLLALQVGSIYVLWYLCADLVYVVLFPQLVMALWFKKANAFGAAAGIAVGLFLRIGAGEPLLGLPAFLPYPMTGADGVSLFPFRTFSMLMNFAAIAAVSVLTQSIQPTRPLDAVT